MTRLENKKVLITGAAQGIGLCLAREFAAAGSVLILTDIDAAKLEAAADGLRCNGAIVHTRKVNVAVRAEVEELAAWAERELDGVDVLVNNAGIGHTGELADTTLETWKRLIDVNLWGPLYHIYSFLPAFIKRGSGHIVNVSSGQAFFRLPTWGAYASVKLALGAFSEILRVEIAKYGLKVTTVYPFMVNTGFYREMEADSFLGQLSMKLVPYYSMSPEKVARIIFKAVKHDKKVEMVSLLNDAAFYSRLLPVVPDVISYAANLFLAKGAHRA